MSYSPDHVTEDRIVDLLAGLLPEDDARDVLAHLKRCGPCEARFIHLVRHQETLKSRPFPGMTAGGKIVPPSTVGDSDRRSSGRRWMVRAGGVAAVAAAVVALFVFMPRGIRESARTTRVYWMPTEDDEITMRAGEDIENLRTLARGIELYRSHDTAEAVSTLESIEFGKPLRSFELIRSLYLASALVNQAEYQSALTALSNHGKVTFSWYPQPWRQRARWVAYLAYRGLEQDNAAEQLLDVLVVDEGEIGDLARSERERRSAGRSD